MKSIKVPNAIEIRRLHFKKFTRKNYAVFNTMHKVVHIATLLVGYSLILIPCQVKGQRDSLTFSKIIDLEEVEIVGERNEGLFHEIPRIIFVVMEQDVESAPSQSISDLLRYTSNLDARQRGKNGIQSDISIRGGTFDQSMIMLNEIDISDPQTGHLSLNLPVETDAISRIEVLAGPGTQVYGSNAFSGAVNIITAPSEFNTLKVNASAGSFQTFVSSVTINLAGNNFRNLLHYNNGFSEGYAKNTDFRRQGFFYQGEVFTGQGQVELQLGYNTRSFGAYGYYTPKYPDQFESNDLTLLSLAYKTGRNLRFSSNIYWRRHKDRFELFREGSAWYRFENNMTISNDTNNTQYYSIPWYSTHNHHINDAFGALLSLSTTTRLGESTLSWRIRNENIISTNIGYDKGMKIPVRGYPEVYYILGDNRMNMDFHLGQTFHFGPFYASGGILINWNSFQPDKLNVLPGMDLRYTITHFLQLTGSFNFALGMPSFTDLTYEDPSNIGNNELLPYTKQSIEGGLRFLYASSIVSVHLFYEFGEDIIDWVWFPAENRYRPVNVDEYRGEGFEFSSIHSFPAYSEIPFMIHKIRLAYIFMNMHKEIPEEVTKYFNLRHKLTGMIQQQIIQGLILTWNFGFHVREGSYLTYDFIQNNYVSHEFEPYWLLDLRLSYTWKGITVYGEATNILNRKYIDIGSIYQPGRWISGGIKYELQGF